MEMLEAFSLLSTGQNKKPISEGILLAIESHWIKINVITIMLLFADFIFS